MSEDRRRILKMLAESKLSVEEAESLLDALKSSEAGESVVDLKELTNTEQPRVLPKHLRVTVTEHGSEVANIRIPLRLLRAGIKLAAIMPGNAQEKVNQAINERGLDLDLNNLSPEALDDLVESLNDLAIDVDQEDTQVRVFCE